MSVNKGQRPTKRVHGSTDTIKHNKLLRVLEALDGETDINDSYLALYQKKHPKKTDVEVPVLRSYTDIANGGEDTEYELASVVRHIKSIAISNSEAVQGHIEYLSARPKTQPTPGKRGGGAQVRYAPGDDGRGWIVPGLNHVIYFIPSFVFIYMFLGKDLVNKDEAYPRLNKHDHDRILKETCEFFGLVWRVFHASFHRQLLPHEVIEAFLAGLESTVKDPDDFAAIKSRMEEGTEEDDVANWVYRADKQHHLETTPEFGMLRTDGGEVYDLFFKIKDAFAGCDVDGNDLNRRFEEKFLELGGKLRGRQRDPSRRSVESEEGAPVMNEGPSGGPDETAAEADMDMADNQGNVGAEVDAEPEVGRKENAKTREPAGFVPRWRLDKHGHDDGTIGAIAEPYKIPADPIPTRLVYQCRMTPPRELRTRLKTVHSLSPSVGNVTLLASIAGTDMLPPIPAELWTAVVAALTPSNWAGSVGRGFAPHVDLYQQMRQRPGTFCDLLLDALTNKDRWFDVGMADAICLIAWRRREQMQAAGAQHNEKKLKGESRIVYVPGLLPASPEGIPLPALGTDAAWRNWVFGTIVRPSENHIIYVLFNCPQRTVIPFDGAGGRYDCAAFKKAWPGLLDARFKWEVETLNVDPALNDGWVIFDNNIATRDNLGWFKQADALSCGPLACLAAVLTLQGVKPTAANAGRQGPDLTYSASKTGDSAADQYLRDSLLVLPVHHLIDFISQGQHEVWLTKVAKRFAKGKVSTQEIKDCSRYFERLQLRL